jgi:hypothetical protein
MRERDEILLVHILLNTMLGHDGGNTTHNLKKELGWQDVIFDEALSRLEASQIVVCCKENDSENRVWIDAQSGLGYPLAKKIFRERLFLNKFSPL